MLKCCCTFVSEADVTVIASIFPIKFGVYPLVIITNFSLFDGGILFDLIRFYGMSTIVGYLMPNPIFTYIYIYIYIYL